MWASPALRCSPDFAESVAASGELADGGRGRPCRGRLDDERNKERGQREGRRSRRRARGHARSEPERARRRDGAGAGSAKSGVGGHGRHAEAGRPERPVGGDARAEVHHAVRQERGDRAEPTQHDPDAPGIAAPHARVGGHGTAAAAEEMRADEIAPGAPHGPQEERGAGRPGLDGKLEQIAVSVREIDAAGQERRRLEAEVHVLVSAEPNAQHGEGREHRQAAAPLDPAAQAVTGTEAGQQRLDADPERVAERHRDEGGREHERPSKAAHARETAQQQEPGAQRSQERTAGERQDGGQGHDRDAEGRQVAAERRLTLA